MIYLMLLFVAFPEQLTANNTRNGGGQSGVASVEVGAYDDGMAGHVESLHRTAQIMPERREASICHGQHDSIVVVGTLTHKFSEALAMIAGWLQRMRTCR